MDGSCNIVTNVRPVFLWLLTFLTVDLLIYKASSRILCVPSERDAILKFKLHLLDPSHKLTSWSVDGGDCCNWASVVCNNVTGNIIELHLSTSPPSPPWYYDLRESYERSRFRGKIHPSLLGLKQLNYLDLSGNDFGGVQMPSFLGSMMSLTYLNLSQAGIGGRIPHQIGNLSNLLYLDIGGNHFAGSIPQEIGNLSNLIYLDLSGSYESNMDGYYVRNLQWLGGLYLLQYLDLSFTNLSSASDWLSIVNRLPSLTVLHLSYCDFHHHFQPSTINFSSLAILDLSNSYFFGPSLVPNWIYQLKNLVYLQLSNNIFHGPIPDGIQNLTLLQHLDLSENLFDSSIPDWLYKFSHLKFLYLFSNNLAGTISYNIGNLTSLGHLALFDNHLEGKIPISIGNLCNMKRVFISNKKFSQQISEILEVFSKCDSHTLEVLYVTGCQLPSYLTDQIGNFKNLARLYLSGNNIQGEIPRSLGNLTSLIYLDLSVNRFSGFPFGILGSLSKLRFLYIQDNTFNGIVKEAHLNFSHLNHFYASRNQFALQVSPNWSPPFQILEYLGMASWYLGTDFPLWIQSLKHLCYLDIANTQIFGHIPAWVWNTFDNAHEFNLSHNQFDGELSNLWKNSIHIPSIVDLNSNKLNGQLPYISPHMIYVDLSRNQFSGSITHLLCSKHDETKNLEFLILASNNLSGEIPDCWMMWPKLGAVNLANNQLTGILPSSIGSLFWLEVLHLRNNSLFGTFPTFLKNCSKLIALDLGNNQFSGTITSWVGQRLPNLKILLRSNKFSGQIPYQICYMRLLQVLDLAQNKLTGHIPKSIHHLSAISMVNRSSVSYIRCNGANNTRHELLFLKGRVDNYRSILGLITSIDLSSNKLSGEVPMEITRLKGLHFLNVSNNCLRGQIPDSIGNMESLESMDFSRNHFFSEIPQSIAMLSFLSFLNLSSNDLEGKIPTGTQLQSFEASCFVGNHLCGPPLSNNCPSTDPDQDKDRNLIDHREGIDWFSVSITLGFVVGFWVVVAPLLYSRSWRYIYFQFLDSMWYKLQLFLLDI